MRRLEKIIAISVHEYLHGSFGSRVVAKLRDVGLQMESIESPDVGSTGLLSGKVLVVTGKLKSHTRDEIESLIQAHGGRATSSVSKKTDYLVAGEKAGSKLTKAEKLGIQVLSEEDFERMVGI